MGGGGRNFTKFTNVPVVKLWLQTKKEKKKNKPKFPEVTMSSVTILNKIGL